MSYLRKSVSILLVFMMIVSLFTIVPITASAASGDRSLSTPLMTATSAPIGATMTAERAFICPTS